MTASEISDFLSGLPSLEQIDEAIQKAMEDGPETDSRSVWTRCILNAVNRTKPDDDRIVTYPCRKGRRSEYLVDLVWSLEQNREWEGYGGLLLAVECEWGGDQEALWEDFIKLADVRADLKIFVGAAWSGLYEERERLLHAWASFLSNHRHVRECEEILVALCGKKGERHGSWVVGPGKVRRLRDS